MLEHSNKTKKFSVGYITNARPGAKAFRFGAEESVSALAKEMLRLKILLKLRRDDLYYIIKKEFGEGIGKHTIILFMDEVYGPAFRPRAKTLDKYKYLVWFLQNKEKEFAYPAKSCKVSNVQEGHKPKTNQQ